MRRVGSQMLVAVAIVSGCSSRTQLEDAVYPLAEVRAAIDGSEVWCRLAQGVQLAEMFDLGPAKGFESGISPDVARRLYGEPERTEPFDLGRIYTYKLRETVVQIVESQERSSVDSTIATHFELRIPVRDPPFSDGLPAPIKKLWLADTRRLRVALVSENRKEPVVVLTVNAGRVKAMSVAWRPSEESQGSGYLPSLIAGTLKSKS